MKLIELTTVNFMPYKGKMTIAFPTDASKNIMLVYGDNMRGKTSLLNALRWAFYGKALGRHSRELPLHSLVNSEAALEGDWTMESCVIFEAGGHRYEYRRRAVKGKLVSKPSRPTDFEVERALKKDDMVMRDDLIDAEINRYAPEQTSRFFLFDGELLQEYESLLIDGSDQGSKIKASIEQALGVPALIRGRVDAQTLLKEAQKQQTKDLDKVSGLERLIERQADLQTQSDSHATDLLDLGEQLTTTREERTKIDDFIEETEQVHLAKERLTAHENSLETNADLQREAETERLILMRDAWKDLIRPQIALKRQHLADQIETLSDQLIQRAKVEATIAQLKKSMDTATCHACGQPLHQEQREKAGAELGELQAKLRGMPVDEDSRNKIGADIKEMDRLLAASPAAQIAKLDRDLARLKVEQTKLDNEIETLKDLIRGQDTAEIARQRALRDGLVKAEGSLEQKIREVKASAEKVARDLAMNNKVIDSMPNAATFKSTQVVKLAGALERIYGRSIDKLRDDLKQRVEQLASQAFKSMTTQSKYSGLKINSNYGLSILDERGHEVAIRSAGAEQIVALSLIDGLARAGRAAGPVVMDTPFGRLDLRHRANILKYLPTTTNQLVLFVHEGELNKGADLQQVASRIGCVYEIKEVSPRQSIIEKVNQ